MKKKIIAIIICALGFISGMFVTKHETYQSPLYGDVQVFVTNEQNSILYTRVTSITYFNVLDIMVIEYVEAIFHEETNNWTYQVSKVRITNAEEQSITVRILDTEDWQGNFWFIIG